jgi:hypothetical protein
MTRLETRQNTNKQQQKCHHDDSFDQLFCVIVVSDECSRRSSVAILSAARSKERLWLSAPQAVVTRLL